MWEYRGINDRVRLFMGRASSIFPEVLEGLMMELVRGPAELEPLPARVVPLYQDPQRESILAGLPACDEWGIRGRTPPKARAPAASAAVLIPAPSTRAVHRGGGPSAVPSASILGPSLAPAAGCAPGWGTHTVRVQFPCPGVRRRSRG